MCYHNRNQWWFIHGTRISARLSVATIWYLHITDSEMSLESCKNKFIESKLFETQWKTVSKPFVQDNTFQYEVSLWAGFDVNALFY